ncbi:MAG: aminopeptidase [Patescibacteria group bacterium]|nr:aminopeptidase [Patescibacteria group bacterium]MDD5164145.1 aminopeptidase [Patescibacteria group bacterium]MDD5534521.1 aminopeptidase [Patescibacteria group bacterium]
MFKEKIFSENQTEKESEILFLGKIEVAKKSLENSLKLKPEEKVLFLKDEKTNLEVASILEKAVSEIGSEFQEILLDKQTRREEIKELLKKFKVVIDVSEKMYPAIDNLSDKDIVEYGNRLLTILDLGVDAFKKDGALDENLDDLEYRLNKMEAVLKDARGFKITSNYGTNLEVGLRPSHERRWFKDGGVLDKPGQWGNFVGGEIFTTPDERTVNGILILPVLESIITSDQGVDEFVKINIKNGLIASIEGGKSAEKLKSDLKEDMQDEVKESGKPLNVLRVAEIAFGANSKARSTVSDPEQPYDFPGVSIIEAEKRFGTMHLAFGDSKHGEKGTEGFETATSHYDFVIPRNGLTVEMFTREEDWKKKNNGKKIISNGGLNFF